MIIYKQYNQAELNNQYNNRLHVPDFADYLDRWQQCSVKTTATYSSVKDIAYGQHPRETLDLFPANRPNGKVLVFIHGGYWQLFDKTMFHFIAPVFLRYNISVVLINYPLAPDATMDTIVDATKKAISQLHDYLSDYNLSANGLYIAGHSAGAHLAAMLCSEQWPDNLQKTVKGLCLLSGLYNLLPIQLSNRNEVLQMDLITTRRNSPVLLPNVTGWPMLIAIGAAETEEFKAQSSEWFSKNSQLAKTSFIEVPGGNHFSILDALVDETSVLHQSLKEMMNV